MHQNLKTSGRSASEGSLPRLRGARAILSLSLISWLAIVGLGLWAIGGYANTPGVSAESPREWPSRSRIQLAQDRSTLVMLAHPHCPCTRASIGQLAAIMAHSQGRLGAYVLFLKPAGFADDWEKTDLWQSAANIPGVTVVMDDDGSQAHLFKAATSGQSVLYNQQGQLLFSGGITGARGHFGDNLGQASIVSIINSQTPDRTETSVFGCPLFEPQSECRTSTDDRSKD